MAAVLVALALATGVFVFFQTVPPFARQYTTIGEWFEPPPRPPIDWDFQHVFMR
jgi:hypothetical protein